jgi:hypothetical protein
MERLREQVHNLLNKMNEEPKDEVILAHSALLNKPGQFSTAAVAARITVERGSHWVSDDYELAISDCHKSIRLEIPFAKAEDAENSVHKVDVLIDALVRVREAIITAHQRHTEIKAELDAKKEEDDKNNKPDEPEAIKGEQRPVQIKPLP